MYQDTLKKIAPREKMPLPAHQHPPLLEAQKKLAAMKAELADLEKRIGAANRTRGSVDSDARRLLAGSSLETFEPVDIEDLKRRHQATNRAIQILTDDVGGKLRLDAERAVMKGLLPYRDILLSRLTEAVKTMRGCAIEWAAMDRVSSDLGVDGYRTGMEPMTSSEWIAVADDWLKEQQVS